jgi:hypothetical protein
VEKVPIEKGCMKQETDGKITAFRLIVFMEYVETFQTNSF